MQQRKPKKIVKRKKKVVAKKTKENFTFTNSDGVSYEILFTKPNTHHYGEADGTCGPPDIDNPKIHINPYLTKRNELNTIVHEFAHAFFWDKTEKEVYKFANALSRFLYLNQSWRRLSRRKPSPK